MRIRAKLFQPLPQDTFVALGNRDISWLLGDLVPQILNEGDFLLLRGRIKLWRDIDFDVAHAQEYRPEIAGSVADTDREPFCDTRLTYSTTIPRTHTLR